MPTENSCMILSQIAFGISEDGGPLALASPKFCSLIVEGMGPVFEPEGPATAAPPPPLAENPLSVPLSPPGVATDSIQVLFCCRHGRFTISLRPRYPPSRPPQCFSHSRRSQAPNHCELGTNGDFSYIRSRSRTNWRDRKSFTVQLQLVPRLSSRYPTP